MGLNGCDAEAAGSSFSPLSWRLALPLLALALAGCSRHPVEEGPAWGVPSAIRWSYWGLVPDRDVDLLFVIDNSGSMEQEQKNLRVAFPKLIEALRTPRLGPQAGSSKPCNDTDRSGCKIPNLRIGVITSDLGAGTYNLPSCETPGGDAGRLQNRPKVAGCTPPRDPWIAYNEGTPNVPGTGDPVELVKDAFACIAEVGILGCGYEQTLEASRRALDPTLNTNFGFLRNDPKNSKDAILAVVYITDEDDCSAANQQLFDPTPQGLEDPLGPLTSYRCFEFGITCDCGAAPCTRTTVGVRKNCVPGGSKPYLHSVDSYINFFKNLKRTPENKPNPGRLVMAAIAGPTERVEVQLHGKDPELQASCTGTGGWATPGIRLETLVHAFARELTGQALEDARKQNVPTFTDPKTGTVYEENFTSICAGDFSPALQRVGAHIVGSMNASCLKSAPATEKDGVLCAKGDVLCDAATCGTEVVCEQSCLDRANVAVETITSAGRTRVERCPANLFDPSVAANACGSSCPCWRVIRTSHCAAQSGSSPYALEVMSAGAAEATFAYVSTSTYAWGSRELASQPRCR